jgi:predicted phage terminase large subunit-like protein
MSRLKLPPTRLAAIEWYRTVLEAAAQKSDEHLHEARRELCKRDLFYLLVGPLKRKDVNRDWLFDRCREVQAEPDNHIDLWARGHWKSSIITFGLTIQDILNDPEITIGIFSDTNKVAKAFLRQIKSEFEINTDLQALFPDILWANPRKEAPKWSEDEGIVVKRRSNPKEQTVEAFGLLDGQPTGRHFRLRVYDDVVTVESVTTPDMIEKVTQRLALSDNLGSEHGRKRYVGTYYHAADSYVQLVKTGEVTPRIYPATVDGTETGEPVLLTREEIGKKRRVMGPYVFSCQMLLNPTADRMQGFRQEWIRYWSGTNIAGLNLYLICDPASGKRKDRGDYTSMWVIGIGPDGAYYLVDGVRDRLNLTKRAEHLMRLHREYRPLRVGYEQYGLQADIEHVRYLQDQQNYRFDIVELGGSMPKVDRIKRLVPLFEQGRFYLPHSLVRFDEAKASVDLVTRFVEDEYLSFPVSAHDDMLDCMARITDADLGAVAPEPNSQAAKWARGEDTADDYSDRDSQSSSLDWLTA